MPRIFISYRRADSQFITDHIYERLVQEFGEKDVFLDVEPDDIPAGADFRKILQDAVAQCDIILVIIGPTWLNIKENNDPNVRRLDNENDWVRIEVKTGLEREQRDEILVIPVLVGGAQMPADTELPDALKELAFRNARIVRRHPDLGHDMNRLIDRIKDYSKTTRQKSSGKIPRRFWVFGAALGAALAIVMLLNATGIIKLIAPTPEPTLDERSQAIAIVAQNETATIEANKTATIGAIMTSFVTETSVAIAAVGTSTADAYTDTPTVTPLPSNTPTDDYTATTNAQGTLDAQATLSVPTNTPPPTATSTLTPTSTTAPTATPTPTLTVTPNIAATQTVEAAQLATAQQNAQATQAAARTELPGESENNLALQIKGAFEGSCGTISSDGHWLLVDENDKYAVYDVATGENHFAITGYGMFSPDSSLIAVSGDGVYEVATKEKRFAITGYGVFSPDSSLVAVSGDGVYDVATRERRFAIVGSSATFSPDGNLVAISGDGVYDVATRERRFAITGYGVFSPDSSLVAVSGDGVYDVVTRERRFAITGYGVFSPDGNLVTVSGDGVYYVATGRSHRAFSSLPGLGFSGVFSPDSSLVAVRSFGSFEGHSRDGVFNIATGLKRFAIESSYFYSGSSYSSFSPDGNLLMTDRGIYKVENGEQVTPLGIDFYPSFGIATLNLNGCYLLGSGARIEGSPEGFLVSNSSANFNLSGQPNYSTFPKSHSTLAYLSLSQEGELYKVEYKPGEFGWVSASVVDVVSLPIILPTGAG